MNVLRRVDRSRRGSRRLTDQIVVDKLTVQNGFRLAQALRPIAGADDANMRVAHPSAIILVVKERDRGECEIALALREFLEGPTPIYGPEGQVQLCDDLVRLAHRRQR